jgi:hypothetical protein
MAATVLARMWARVDEMRGITTVVFYGPRGCGPNRIPRTRARSPPCNRSARSGVRSGSARGRRRTGTESTAAGATGQRAPQVSGRMTGRPHIPVRSRGNRAGMVTDAWGHAVGAPNWLMGRAGVIQSWAKKGLVGPFRLEFLSLFL